MSLRSTAVTTCVDRIHKELYGAVLNTLDIMIAAFRDNRSRRESSVRTTLVVRTKQKRPLSSISVSDSSIRSDFFCTVQPSPLLLESCARPGVGKYICQTGRDIPVMP